MSKVKNNVSQYNNENQIRTKKLYTMKSQGFNFPNTFKPSITLKKIRQQYSKKNFYELKQLHVEVSIAGRMVQRRIMGKASFFILQDVESQMQIYVREEDVTYEFYHKHFKKWDIGDILAVQGVIFKTKTEELSIICKNLKILNKSLKPLPEKFHGLSNQEIRYRQRYLDLISNNQLYDIFKKRSDIIMEIRKFMINHEFLEVETPILQDIPGGANARPFITYHNEMHSKMHLRIAPELYLKKLIIGGFNRIFELNKNFRNEGISTRHNPEFTMMEAYIAYSTYKDMMILVQDLCKSLTTSIFGKNIIQYNQEYFDFGKPFYQFTMQEAILKFNNNIESCDLNNIKKLKTIAISMKIDVQEHWSLGYIQNEIFEKTVEKKLIQPTFITKYPVEVSPLAKSNKKNTNITDRFEFFVAGYELGNGFSELNDAEEQENRFLDQITQAKCKKKQHVFYDESYIESLKYGLPPTSGLGIGIDRLIMILTNQPNIRDVILFPTLRLKKKK